MTNLQVVKALDLQIEASFKSREGTPEQRAAHRADIRKIQDVFRAAHRANVTHAKVKEACGALLRSVTPEMGRELASIINRYDF